MTILGRDPSKPSLGSAIPADVRIRNKPRTKEHPHPYLSGNFYPVFEETVGDEGIECEVVGTIPESLRSSQYVRTGPNSLVVPDDSAPHHFFDGDGMLHGVYFQSDESGQGPIRPRYMNRYARSEIFYKTNRHGPLALSLGLISGVQRSLFVVLLGLLWSKIKAFVYGLKNVGNGNTALTFHNSRLLALQEAGAPVETSVPSLNTTAASYYYEPESGKKAPKSSLKEIVTAHPKHDPHTGEMRLFSWHLEKPFAIYSVVSAEGKRIRWEEPIPGLQRTSFMHDMGATPTYSVIIYVPFMLDPPKHIREGRPILTFEEETPTRFGIIPKYFDASKDKVLWFEHVSSFMFHTGNCWDEHDADGNVVAVCMTACRSRRLLSDITLWQPTGPEGYGGGKTPSERATHYGLPGSGEYDRQDPDGTYLTLFRFDLKTMETQLTTLSTVSSEFPVMNFDRFMNPDLRYTYSATIADSKPGVGVKLDGVVKTDVQAVIQRRKQLAQLGQLKNAGGIGKWELGSEELVRVSKESERVYKFGPHHYGGEAVYVPNNPPRDGSGQAEDDGHLLVYVYDERQIENGLAKSKEQVTELWIINAQKIEEGPVAKVKIPRRVPYGFHGLHISKEQIESNQSMLRRRAENHAKTD